jgi:hypothetical protein
VAGNSADLVSALDDLVLGRGVARGRHLLVVDGRDVSAEFLDRLRANGFREALVREIEIEPGQRVPAFFVHDETADFGYVRWEIFTPRSRRKLFASEFRRQDTHEWAIQIAPGSSLLIHANTALTERHDVETLVPVIR